MYESMFSKRITAVIVAALTSILIFAGVLATPSLASADAAPISLGTAVNYAVLGGSGVTSTGATVLNGDLGVSPGVSSSITGFPPGEINGSTDAGDPQAAQAQTDAGTAYATAAALTPTAADFAGDQNGVTFDAGVYNTAAAFTLTGTMTLDGQGDPNSVFIFQVDAALNTAASSTIKLVNGAQASNIFWQVTGAVSTGASSSFSGTLLAAGAITIGAGASLDGGALSEGLVTLADNTITAPDAVTFISPPTPTSALTSATTNSVLATGSAGDTGAITYASNTPSVCTVGSTSGALTYVTFGTCTVGATQAADVVDGDGVRSASTSFKVRAPTAPISLGTTVNYAVLGGSGVTSTGATVLNGDLGVSPGVSSSITGFPPGEINGSTDAGDPQAAQAQTDAGTAYATAAALTPTAADFAGDQNGVTFDAGVYNTAAAFTLTGTMTLDGQGDPNSVFIFQVDAALNTAASSTIKLVNGAQASNIFWQVTGAVSTGASSSFSGTLLAAGAITIGAGASLDGGALSEGLVTLADNTITATDPLAVTSLSPNTGPTSGGTTVTITGTGFTGATAVTFAGVPASSFTVNSDTSITAVSPASSGSPNVAVTTAGGTSASVAGDVFTFVVVPAAITSLSPNSGPASGGTTVTITGTGFTGATAVIFAGVPVSFTVNSDTSITAVSPAYAAGAHYVVVTTPAGTSVKVAGDMFTYVSDLNVITSLSPNSGPASGGTTVTITGTGFTGATAVIFAGVPVSFTVNSDTSITAVSPAYAAGAHYVVVTTPAGTSVKVAGDMFTYVSDLNVITSLSPNSGPASGGTTVTISGTGFTGATAVIFAGVPVSFTVNSDTSITAVSPAYAAGAHYVVVTTPAGTSVKVAGDMFTYVSDLNVITSLSPNSGPASGGTTVTISGTGFTGATAVIFAGVPVSFTVNSDTSITAVSPAYAAGAHYVVVTTPAGTSVKVAGDMFTYVAIVPQSLDRSVR